MTPNSPPPAPRASHAHLTHHSSHAHLSHHFSHVHLTHHSSHAHAHAHLTPHSSHAHAHLTPHSSHLIHRRLPTTSHQTTNHHLSVHLLHGCPPAPPTHIPQVSIFFTLADYVATLHLSNLLIINMCANLLRLDPVHLPLVAFVRTSLMYSVIFSR